MCICMDEWLIEFMASCLGGWSVGRCVDGGLMGIGVGWVDGWMDQRMGMAGWVDGVYMGIDGWLDDWREICKSEGEDG